MIRYDRITGKSVLRIFDIFRTDHNLPKFDAQSTNPKPNTANFVVTTTGPSSCTSSSSGVINMMLCDTVDGSVPIMESKTEKSNVFLKFWNSIFNRKLHVRGVFAQICENLEHIWVFNKERERYINATLEMAIRSGQTALAEKLKSAQEVNLLESKLYALGFIKTITEEQFVKFTRDSESGLSLYWISNFTSPIPPGVIDKKDKADSLKLFDNYVILHFVPPGKNGELTKAEIEMKKDSILFGVFKESRKLYYIGDWIDEYRDLTFDSRIDKLGEKTLKLKRKII